MFDTCLRCVGLRSRDKMGDKGRSAWRRWTTRKRLAENYPERIVSVAQTPLTTSPADGETTEESQTQFVDNDIKTSKYTLFTFLPR